MTDRMPHPLAAFERIYIINLASRTDRRAEMAEQLERVGLAIDSPQVRVFPAVRPLDAGAFTSVGAHGCFMSHLGVLRDAYAAGLERILILEDDLNFAPDFMARAPQLMAQLGASDWAIFYGGHELHGAPPPGAGSLEIPPSMDVQTAHFVAFRGRAIGDMVGYLEAMLGRIAGDPRGGPMHVGGAYCWFRRAHPHHRTFIAIPELGYQRASRTDIHRLRWLDRTPVVRELVALLRRTRNRRVARMGAR
jgi:glycosyl transferase family 25